MGFGSGSIIERGTPYVLKAAGTVETASAAGGAVAVSSAGSFVVTVAVTAASGTTPTLVVAIDGSVDGTNWFELGRVGADGVHPGQATTATNFTTAATAVGALTSSEYVRARSIIAGTTPSFTYGVTIQTNI